MKSYYINLNIPKAYYALNKTLKYFVISNRITKKFVKFFCYNFFVLFLSNNYKFYNLLSFKKIQLFIAIYKQFCLQYLTLFFYLFGSFRLKLLTVGSGFFFEQVSKNIVNFYLGYSHLITVETSVNTILQVVGRKQRILIIQSHDLISLRNLGFLLKSLHVPDSYRGKGIRYLYETLVLKKGKKKFV